MLSEARFEKRSSRGRLQVRRDAKPTNIMLIKKEVDEDEQESAVLPADSVDARKPDPISSRLPVAGR